MRLETAAITNAVRALVRTETVQDGENATAASRRLTRAVWIVAGIALVCIVAFDLGPPLAFNDDWDMAWGVRHFNPLHIQVYPSGSALALVQIVFAWAVTLGHADQRLLRLTELPFITMTMLSTYGLARRLGSGNLWSSIAAASPLAFPVYAADATTFMTDVPYVGLLCVAALGAVRWSDGRRWIVVCVGFAALATLQRQLGMAIAPAVTIAFLLFRREGISRRDYVGLVALWAACAAAVVVPALAGIAPPTQANRVHAALAPEPVYMLSALMFLPGMVGLGLISFLPGLALTSPSVSAIDRTRLVLFALLLVEVLVFAVNSGDVFQGNVFQPRGFILTGLAQDLKAQLFPTPFFLLLEIAAVASSAYMVRRWRCFTFRQVGQEGICLLCLAALQFLPLMLVHYIQYDRYFLPVVALLVPLAARAASTSPATVLAGRLSLSIVAAMVVVYVVGEQDYQAWQVARDQTARLAYQQASPYEVNAGYEANAVYGEVPYYDKTGVVLGGLAVPGAYDFSIDGPRNPRLVLEFAKPDDPRPGYTYSSLAPGKIVIRPGP